MMVVHWAKLLAHSRLSTALQAHSWLVPLSQSVHIVCLSILFVSVLMLSLRLMGVGRRRRSIAEAVGSLLPWIYRALMALAVTGVLQTLIEPMRQFVAPLFWTKMLLIACVLALTLAFGRLAQRSASRWDTGQVTPVVRLYAILSIALWLGIIFCGRFIAYTYALYL
jgi:hypothetical protein